MIFIIITSDFVTILQLMSFQAKLLILHTKAIVLYHTLSFKVFV